MVSYEFSQVDVLRLVPRRAIRWQRSKPEHPDADGLSSE